MSTTQYNCRHGFSPAQCSKPVMLAASLILLTGCGTGGQIFRISEVKPWERGTLARDDMQLTTDAMDQSVDDHIYFSKEASTGGGSIKGGGCGCN